MTQQARWSWLPGAPLVVSPFYVHKQRESKSSLSLFCSSSSHRMFSLLLPYFGGGSRLFLARPLPLISFPLRSSATGKEVLRQRRRGHKRVFAVWRGAVQKVLLCHILIFLCSPDVVLNVLKKPPDSCYVLVPIL